MTETLEHHLLHRAHPLEQGKGLVFPDYAKHCIVNVPSLIARLLGVDDAPAPLMCHAEPFLTVDRIVLLVLDGLGYNKAQSLFSRYPSSLLRQWASDGSMIPLTSVFPSTTVAALTSLSTGATPLEHGLIGYRLFLRETASVTNMIRFDTVGNSRPGSAFAIGLDPEKLVPQPTLHQQLAAAGVDAHSLIPSYIADSGLSNALYRGAAKVHPAASLPDMLVRAREILQGSSRRTFLSLYWNGLDNVGHEVGPDSASYAAEFCAVDDALRRAVSDGVEDTLFIVTSDHGFVSMSPQDYLLLDSEFDTARALVMPPVGEPRASYLHTRTGGGKIVERAFSGPREDGLICMGSEDLLSSGLLGIRSPHPEIVNRIGDFSVLSTGTGGVFHDYPGATTLRGMHGGLTADEMLVPLLMKML